MRRSGRSRFSGWRRSRARWAARQAAQSGRMTRVEQRLGRRVGPAVGGGLGLGVGQRGDRAHQAAGEAVGALVAVGVEDQADGDAGAVGAVDERAEVAGQPVGQHRHDAVGEVGRVAAAAGLAVERGAGADVVGDVGDRDPDDVAAGVRRVVVGVGEDGVVVVAGVGGVDGDEAAASRRSSRSPRRGRAARPSASASASSGKSSGMPCSWMAISDTAFGAEGSPRRATTRARGRPWARAGPTCSASTSSPSRAPARSPGPTSQSRSVRLSIAAMRPPVRAVVVDADDAARAHADAADHPGGERSSGAVGGSHPAEQPVAGAERRVVAAGADEDARGAGRRPPTRPARPRGRRRRRRR